MNDFEWLDGIGENKKRKCPVCLVNAEIKTKQEGNLLYIYCGNCWHCYGIQDIDEELRE